MPLFARLMPARLIFAPVLACLALAACDAAPAPATDDAGRAASGEVLQGAISDDMLAIEGLGSQPPVAAPLPGESKAAETGDDPQAADAASDAPAATGAPPASAETPAEPTPDSAE